MKTGKEREQQGAEEPINSASRAGRGEAAGGRFTLSIKCLCSLESDLWRGIPLTFAARRKRFLFASVFSVDKNWIGFFTRCAYSDKERNNNKGEFMIFPFVITMV